MKLYAIINYHKSNSMQDIDDYVVVAILDEEQKTKFFRNLNMFARDFYDCEEFTLNESSEHMKSLTWSRQQ